jgi:tRNA(His) guanylyltransferase
MKREDFEKLGDLHKAYEARTETKLLPGCPVIIRLDGRSFHTFTKGLKRPYDERMSQAMIDTTKDLLEQTGANIGYCQSDEISLGFRNTVENPIIFSGRVQKMVSVVAAIASVRFCNIISQTIPERAHMMPVFDARVFQYPNLQLACETFLWRETDATRNSLTMAAHSMYSPKELHQAGFKKKHDMLHAKGVNWNNYPAFFKRGTYVGKRTVMKQLSMDELAKIPEKFRKPDKQFARSVVMDLQLPEYTKISNVEQVFFYNQDTIEFANPKELS